MVCRALQIIGIAALAVTVSQPETGQRLVDASIQQGSRLDQFLRFHVTSTDRSASLMIRLTFSLLYDFYLLCIYICQSVAAQFGIVPVGNEVKEVSSK
jgi:hypothetical protein